VDVHVVLHQPVQLLLHSFPQAEEQSDEQLFPQLAPHELLQVVVQLVEHPSLHVVKQFVEHPLPHSPVHVSVQLLEQLEEQALHPESFVQEVSMGVEAINANPRIGNAFFAASLKNCLLP
jgi:hypothetical protein